jgi:hypothetical protein
MNNSYAYLLLRFLVLVAAQVLLVDHINLGGYINPPVYILFILLLPFQIPGWLLLVSAFFLGLSIDLFSNSTGLHAASTVFVAFMRPAIIKWVGAPAEYEEHLQPGIADMGFRWFAFYSFFIILTHQFVLSLLESFFLAEIGLIFLRMILSTIVTLIFILIINYLFMREKKR